MGGLSLGCTGTNQRGNRDSGFGLQSLSVASGLSLPPAAKFLEQGMVGSFLCPRSTRAQEFWRFPFPAWCGGHLGLLNGFFWTVTGGVED